MKTEIEMKNSFGFWRKRKKSATVAVLLSTVLCCFLTVSVMSSCSDSKEKTTKADTAKMAVDSLENVGKRLNEKIRADMERFRADSAKLASELITLNGRVKFANQFKEIESINNRMRLLESAKRSIEERLRQPLLQTNITYPLIRMDSLGTPRERTWLPVGGKRSLGVTITGSPLSGDENDTADTPVEIAPLPTDTKDSRGGVRGWIKGGVGKLQDAVKKARDEVGVTKKSDEAGIMDIVSDLNYRGSYNEDTLAVIIYDINAKIGVDLYDVKVSAIDGGVAVSGIIPKSIDAQIIRKTTMVREIRHRIYDKNGTLSSTIILNDNDAKDRASAFAEKCDDEFQQNLRNGTELPFMENIVADFAQTFIKAALAPLYKDIKFVTVDRPGSMPIIEYLQKELTDGDDRKNTLAEEIERIKQSDSPMY